MSLLIDTFLELAEGQNMPRAFVLARLVMCMCAVTFWMPLSLRAGHPEVVSICLVMLHNHRPRRQGGA